MYEIKNNVKRVSKLREVYLRDGKITKLQPSGSSQPTGKHENRESDQKLIVKQGRKILRGNFKKISGNLFIDKKCIIFALLCVICHF